MIIYNVTANIEESIHDEWLTWIKEHIPKVLGTGKFEKATLSRVLVEEDMGGCHVFCSIPFIFARSLGCLLQRRR